MGVADQHQMHHILSYVCSYSPERNPFGCIVWLHASMADSALFPHVNHSAWEILSSQINDCLLTLRVYLTSPAPRAPSETAQPSANSGLIMIYYIETLCKSHSQICDGLELIFLTAPSTYYHSYYLDS
ncbi:unnamed protein product [Leptidea sinapis]|uniref:Uncharacterized protein n=1 Tax=Leptidea sinapis TaxID=189913 RepID=A0A5E4R709_9NEOP|nr:unnamed protein product [Leptidea sinapis]